MERVKQLPLIPQRLRDAHKGTFGRALLIVGSPDMPGAAVLCARSALRSGAGLVTAAVPASLMSTLGTAVPEATQLRLPEPGSPDFARDARTALEERFRGGADAVAIGPGIGTADSARVLVETTVRSCEAPMVLDADAINLVARSPDLIPAHPERCVWTPHPGEFHRLTGTKPSGEPERIEGAVRLAERLRGVVVLKGHGTVVAERGRYFVNHSGNPGMATGGSGDVLTGILVALLAQGWSPFEAAALAVSLHGAAGDSAASLLGESSLVAGDIVDHLPEAFRGHSSRAPPRGDPSSGPGGPVRPSAEDPGARPPCP